MRRNSAVPAIAALLLSLAGCPQVQAGGPAGCGIRGADELTGSTQFCLYVGQPPLGKVVATVAAGGVEFVWRCDADTFAFFVFAGGTAELVRARTEPELCSLHAVVVLGPATYWATAT